VPIEVKELYTASLENRKSLSVIESISADGHTPLPPIVICLGKRYMTNWFYKNLEGREQVVLSNTGYTNEKISID
jgi:hypothetical protein